MVEVTDLRGRDRALMAATLLATLPLALARRYVAWAPRAIVFVFNARDRSVDGGGR